MSTTDKPTWQLAEQICEVPAVDEAIRTFVEDNTGDNAIGLVLAVLEHQAATEAAKATSVAVGELPPLPDPHVMPAGYYPDQPKVFTHNQMRAYGQACAEAARQPAPVAIKTWQEREAGALEGEASMIDAMQAEIADLRAALAATAAPVLPRDLRIEIGRFLTDLGECAVIDARMTIREDRVKELKTIMQTLLSITNRSQP